MTSSSRSCSEDDEQPRASTPSASGVSASSASSAASSSARTVTPPISWEEYKLRSVLDATGKRLSKHSGVTVASRDVDPKLRFILGQLEKDLEKLGQHAQ